MSIEVSTQNPCFCQSSIVTPIVVVDHSICHVPIQGGVMWFTQWKFTFDITFIWYVQSIYQCDMSQRLHSPYNQNSSLRTWNNHQLHWLYAFHGRMTGKRRYCSIQCDNKLLINLILSKCQNVFNSMFFSNDTRVTMSSWPFVGFRIVCISPTVYLAVDVPSMHLWEW